MTDAKPELPEEAVLGIERIDRDHSRVYDILTTLQSGEVDDKQFLQIVEDLEDYVVNHFSREEEFMAVFNYPRLDLHAGLHRKFLNNFQDIWSKVNHPDPKALHDFLAFIESWWKNHILIEDRKYSEWLRQQLNSHRRTTS